MAEDKSMGLAQYELSFNQNQVNKECSQKDRQQGLRPLPGYQEIGDNIKNHAQADCLRYQC
jgi:hypothetical protein